MDQNGYECEIERCIYLGMNALNKIRCLSQSLKNSFISNLSKIELNVLLSAGVQFSNQMYFGCTINNSSIKKTHKVIFHHTNTYIYFKLISRRY